jgi:hypothetical protein
MTVLLTECWSKVLRPTAGSLLMTSQPDLMQEQDVVCLRELFVVNPGHVLNSVAGNAFSDSLTMICFSSKANSCNQCLSPLMLCIEIL